MLNKLKANTVRFLCIFCALLVAAAPLSAGRLSEDLERVASRLNPNGVIRVWIELPRVEDPAQLKAGTRRPFRAERHSLVMGRLKDIHASAQENLLVHLDRLRARGQAGAVKPHWIVNVVEAEIVVGRLAELAARDDITIVYSVPEVVTINPDKLESSPSAAVGVEGNLTYINAPAAWAVGYTGQGRIICTFDTGVDGLHPALYDNWKGHDGDSAAAWFDPVDNQSFPHTISLCGLPICRPAHGTQTTGIAVGRDNAAGDTIGVAPDAKWISAAVIDVAGASIIDAFEWAADPDGDPNSLDDVPDVINHSWGVPDIGCQNIFFDMIDNIEAMGIVNIFAAGNEGPASFTIRNPADRANNSLDCFAAGGIDHNTGQVWVSSSRGPSECNDGATKPNVVAPAVGIRTSVPGGFYSSPSGTSFAAPHVSGLVALLRQKNPNATVDQIKSAVLATTDNLGLSLPDNDYGWGVIDCLAALNALPPGSAQPNLRVYSFDHDAISAGDEVTGTLVLKNLGASASGVSVSLLDSNPALDVLAGSASFGNIAQGDTVRADTPFRVAVADTVTEGAILSLDLRITAVGYTTVARLFFVIEPRTARSFVTHSVGNIQFSLTNYGTYGLGDNSSFPAGGLGFRFRSGENDLYDGGLMVGIDGGHVPNGVMVASGEPDGDFAVLPGGNIAFVAPGHDSVGQQTLARFSDSRGEGSIGLEIQQSSFAFDISPNRNFIILRYVVKNTGTTVLTDLYLGLHLDWDVGSAFSNVGGYESTGQFAWIAQNTGSGITQYRGARALHGLFVTAYIDSGRVIYAPPLGEDGYTDAEKFAALSRGIDAPDELRQGFRDLFQVVAVKAHLTPGDIDTVAFALLAGQTFAEIEEAAGQSLEAYIEYVNDGVTPPPPVPEIFALYQNYPNPFNESTAIPFCLESTTDYTLSIYNIVGRKVREFAGRDGPGQVTINFGGESLASGIYLYRLKAGDFTESRKMLLLK
ncbi:MAG: S8 family peptidase [Candidatus Zixiibacteriota bacterium]|nr:MAG: S8 family peptidase [candidate division Zixibacteria bacterium]